MATIVTRETTQTDGTSPKGSPLTNAEVDTNFINLNDDKVEVSGAIIFEAKAAEALSKGDVVYVSGVSGNTPEVSRADADDASKMPAYGLAEADANLNAAVNVVTFGTLYELDTSGFSAGDTVYVSTTAGSLTNSAPAGESSLIQNIGMVVRSHASAGSIKVGGAGRTNATPNLDDGNVFIGNASNQVEARALTGDDISGGTITSFASTGIDDNATSTALTINSSQVSTFSNDVILSEATPALEWRDSDVADSKVRFISTGGILYQRIRGGTSSYGEFRWQRTSDESTYLDTLRIPNNGDIVFHDSTGAQAFRWDASTSRVGIGEQVPVSSLHVNEGDVGAFTSLGRQVATFERNAAAYINLIAGNTASTGIDFGDPDDVDAGGIRFNNADDSFAFRIADDEKVRISSNGNVLIGRTDETLGGGNGEDLQIGSGGGGAGLTIHSNPASNGDIQFADGTTGNASYRGLIRYLHAQDALDFWTAGIQRIRIDADGETSFFGGGVSLAKIGNIGPSSNSAIRISRSDPTVINGNPLGYLEFGSNDATGSTDTAFAYVSAEAEGTFGDGDNPTALTFGVTADGTGSPFEAMRIHNSGSVGIGETDPSDGKLQIAASATAGVFVRDSSSSNAAPYIRVQGQRNDGNVSESFSGGLVLEHYRTDAAVSNNKALGTIYFGGNHTDSSESNIAYGASIVGKAEGTFNSASDMPMALAFFTGSTGRALGTANVDFGTERMRIDSSGHVGIGLSNIEKELEIQLDSTTTTTLGQKGGLQFRAASGTVGNGGEITWASGTGNTERWCAISGHITTNTATGSVGDLVFATKRQQADTTPTERMRITSGGAVEVTTQYADLTLEGEFGQSRLTNGSGASGGFTASNAYSGAGVNFKNSGAVEIYSSNDDAIVGSLTIDTAGNVGIGDSVPQRRLHVNSGATQVTSIFESSGTSSYIDFANSTTAQGRSRIGAEGTDTLVFKTQGSTAMTIGSSGDVDIAKNLTVGDGTDISMGTLSPGQLTIDGDGYAGAIALDATGMHIYHNSSIRDIVVGTNETERLRILAGGGITFNGDTATANALDDYEEGTWTPSVNYGTVNAIDPIYTKIGNTVHVSAALAALSDYTTTEDIIVSGLPFTSGNGSTAMGAVMYRDVNLSTISQITAYVGSNHSQVRFYYSRNDGSNWAILQHNHCDSGLGDLYFSITYRV